MTESKIELTERLRREGRWAEASQFKDETVKKLRASGVKRAEAAEQAWEEMARAFPPPPPSADPPGGEQEQADDPVDETEDRTSLADIADGIDVDAILKKSGGEDPDLATDVLWTYQNLANRAVRPDQAPSLGAWSLLGWARKYQNRFFEQILPKAMTAREKQQKEGGPDGEAGIGTAGRDMGLPEIERLLREVGGDACVCPHCGKSTYDPPDRQAALVGEASAGSVGS